MLYNELKHILNWGVCDSDDTYVRFLKRIEEGKLTRDEHPRSHFCVYFLPYNVKDGTVLLVHHKKANLWIFPGGHIDEGETLLETLNREIDEELGMKNCFEKRPSPILLSVKEIENTAYSCRVHHDIWHLLPTDGSAFHVDPAEFYATKWVLIDEAKKIVTDSANRKALEIVSGLRAGSS